MMLTHMMIMWQIWIGFALTKEFHWHRRISIDEEELPNTELAGEIDKENKTTEIVNKVENIKQ